MAVNPAKVVVITGGATGIGKASALRFARAGYAVLIADVAVEDGESTRDQILAQGGQALFCRTDVARDVDCQNAAQAALDTWGRIDALVASAGLQTQGAIFEATEEDWERILGVNLKGVAYACKAVLPTMIQQRSGALVLVSSLNAVRGSTHMMIYDASKAGVLGLMLHLAVAHGENGVRVNAVCPGVTLTEYHERRFAARGISPAELREKTRGYGLLGRAAEPPEIAAAIYFLASDEASNITGQSLLVDGGLSLTSKPL